MAVRPISKVWGNDNKNFSYLNKDFSSLKEMLIDFTKTYFPSTYSDFNEASPGMVFIEQAAALGDILSFYQDTQLKESMLYYATERKNVMAIAQTMGYKPKVSSPAITTFKVYQLVPSIGTGVNNRPDSRFYLRISDGMQIQSTANSDIIFRTIDEVDFSNSNDREIEVYERDSITGEPSRYLISKLVKGLSGTELTATVSFNTSTDYPTTTLSDTNIISIISITDEDNNKWYEVPYLAQETIFSEVPNTEAFSGLNQYSDTVPYMLEVRKVPRRFSVKVNPDNTHTIQFGPGDTNLNDEIILPNSKNIGLGLSNSVTRLNSGIDPSNFLKTNTFGVAPVSKTLTITYLVGGGVESNVNTGDLTTIVNVQYNEDLLSISEELLQAYEDNKSTVAIENIEVASGGRGAESIEEIRQNALGIFGSQNRAVTAKDYMVRALSMPEKYGSIAKVWVAADNDADINSPSSVLGNPKKLAEFTGIVQGLKDKSANEISTELRKYLNLNTTNTNDVNNPFAVNMYVLGFDSNKKLTNLNQAVKENLKTYLGEYRVLTDTVNIIDGYIVNIGIDFEIICYSNYNKREVLTACVTELQDYFNIDRWTFNKTINISEIELVLANIEGVMSVPMVKVYNLCGEPYSPNRYNVEEATRAKIIYPSLDPCVFEVKFPNKDIKGRAL
jgi:hypothetical protein